MSDWGTGFAIGMGAGLAIGVAAGRKGKPWSELTDREKKVRIAIMAVLGVLVIVGLVMFLGVK
jgi:hypothetical protein